MLHESEMCTFVNVNGAMRCEPMKEPEGTVMDRGKRREEARVKGRGR